ncbi:MAG: hypothetical protein D3923_17420 [Candidatus Electrothrix sp. AR3]|nr:hypothetical protein [Candidatus Electrothrix sp. AR3]
MSDHFFEQQGIKFVVDRELLTTCGAIQVDYSASHSNCCCSGGCAGFRINGEKKYLLADRCHLQECDSICRCDTLSS